MNHATRKIIELMLEHYQFIYLLEKNGLVHKSTAEPKSWLYKQHTTNQSTAKY